MVLESLLTAQIAERKPLKMLPLSVLYSSVGVLLALWIFPTNNLAVIAFTVIAMIPLMVNVMRLEESKEEESKSLIPLRSHKHILPFFVYMFVGLTISFAVWFLVLPHETVSQLFSSQISAISGNIVMNSVFSKIFVNNIRVLAFSIIFSLLYGAGAIFIITWNASLVGVAIANTARTLVAGQSANYFGAFSIGVARYLTHGIPEILAYFIAALAGGIISVALIKRQFGTKKFTHTLLDAFSLIVLSVFLILIAAVVEVTISPMIG